MQASDVRDLDAASWAVVLSPTRDMPPSGMKLRGKDKGKPLEAKAEKASAAKKK